MTCLSIPREEHPNPQFYRSTFLNLNGPWAFEFDDDNRGLAERWHLNPSFTQQIVVPFAFQSTLSGIGDPGFHDVVWYHKSFTLPTEFVNQRSLLHFGAVDYEATVWVNGTFVGRHEGGHTSFCFDISPWLEQGENQIVLRAEDFSRDKELPRGKQYWEEHSANIFYTRTTGIWQTVWLEAVPTTYLEQVKITPDLDSRTVSFEVAVGAWHEAVGKTIELAVDVRFQNQPVVNQRFALSGAMSTQPLSLIGHGMPQVRPWSPEHPNLYDVTFQLLVDGEVLDSVDSYFGVRKISVENGKLLLNNNAYFLRMVLDQGYFPEGNLTPPSDEAIRQDVELTKAMGFNGSRKHQKVEDPRFLYWCDKLGLLVWGEMANAYDFSVKAVRRLTHEWPDAVLRDYNHPCIVAWVPLNESWGVPQLAAKAQQRAFLDSLYALTKALDPTRLVISNDGWEHTKSDLCTIHDYESKRSVLSTRYQSRENALSVTPGGRLMYSPGYNYEGQPILITEMGGISFRKSDWEGWGYSNAESDEDFIQRYYNVTQPMHDSPVIQGFCYTQLTDVEQEINGLLTYDRKPKVPLDIIKSITEGKGIPAK